MIVNEKTVTELIEGNMVATSDGLYNILRASSRQTSQLAAKVTVTSPSKLTFSVSNDFITFPGGGKKFTIRYDEQSRRYWTLSNPAASKYVGMKNDGLYLNGITRDLIRNRLVLCYSTDLITWVPYKTKTPSSTDSNTSIGSSTAATSWPYAAWPAPNAAACPTVSTTPTS